MKTVKLLLLSLTLTFCSLHNQTNKITSAQIFRSEGVGPNSFRLSLEVNDDRLANVLEEGNISLLFSEPLDELNGSIFKLTKVQKRKYDLNIPSMLFIEKSATELKKIEHKLKGELTLTVYDQLKNQWVLKYHSGY